MSFVESLLLLFLIVVGAGAAIYYLQRRDRSHVTPITPYAEGLRAMLDGDHMKAIQKLRDVVSEDTSNIDAYLRLGTLFAETNDHVRAIKIHKSLTFRADLTATQKLQVYHALAADYLRTNDIPRTLEALEQILSLNKKDRWALEKKVELLVNQDDWSGGFDAAQKLANLGGPITPHYLAVLKVQEGIRLGQSKKERDGRIQYREAIKFDNTYIAPYLYWGDSYIREGRTEDAVRIWRRLLSVNPARAHLAFDRLESHLFELGRFSEIEQIYRNLIRSYPQNVHAYAALSRFLDKRGDKGDAIAVLQDGLAHNPESLWIRRLLIQNFGEMHDMEHVMDLARDILTRVMKTQYEFTCSNCGHVAVEPEWHCPRCNKLDTFNV